MAEEQHNIQQSSYEKLYIFDEDNQEIPISAQNAMSEAMKQNTPVGIIAGYYDENLTIWAAGNFFLQNLGYTIENFKELTDYSLIKLIKNDSAYPFSLEAFERMQGQNECYMLSSEGSPVFVRTFKLDTQDQFGRPVWVLSTRISRSSQNLALINGLIKTGSWTIDYDTEGKIKQVKLGNSFRHMLGFTNKEEFPNTIETWLNRVHPDERLNIIRLFDEIPFKRNTDRYDAEYRMMLKNGEFQWFRTNARVIRRVDGTVDSLVGVLINTDREKRMMRENTAMDQMIQGVVRLVERFALCDLENDRYEYFEKDGRISSYKPVGQYEDFIMGMDEKFILLKNNKGSRISELLSVNNLRDTLRSDEHKLTFEYKTHDNQTFRMMSVVPVAWKNGVLIKTVMIAQDVGQKYEYENLANTDALTGLYNLRYMSSLLKDWADKKEKFALFFMDMDAFKTVNDTYGHRIGDELLNIVASRLRGCTRGSDEAFRIGGDEFALMVSGEVDENLCRNLMRRLQKVVGRTIVADGREMHVQISCGYAVYPDDSLSIEQLRILADRRMYDNKAEHKRELLGH